MTALDEAGRPRWHGQPGFFEIWFLVVFDVAHGGAWWLRYTTFAPAAGAARATVWAAAFEPGRAPLARKAIHVGSAWRAPDVQALGIAIDGCRLDAGTCAGAVEGGGHRLAWELALETTPTPPTRGPAWLHHLPAPTRVEHLASEMPVRGWVAVDDRRHELHGALGVLKHIWGTRRVEELYWLYCPRFTERTYMALEATQVCPRRPRPRLTMAWLGGGARPAHRLWGPLALGSGRIVADRPGRLRVAVRSATAAVVARAECDPATLVGWVYRDPAGWDVHVAQSDVATCVAELRTRPHPLAPWSTPERLTAPQAAIEFHHPEPLPGVRYAGWDAAAISEEAS